MLRTSTISLLHHSPGRLRVRLAALRGNRGLAADMALLCEVPGIETARASPLTGSLLVTYDVAQLGTPQAARALLDALRRLLPELFDGDVIRLRSNGDVGSVALLLDGLLGGVRGLGPVSAEAGGYLCIPYQPEELDFEALLEKLERLEAN